MQAQTKISKKTVLAKVLTACGVTFGDQSAEASVAGLSDENVESTLSFFIQDKGLKGLATKAESVGLNGDEYGFFESQLLHVTMLNSGGPIPYI